MATYLDSDSSRAAFVLRLPVELKSRIEQEAHACFRSLTAQIVMTLSQVYEKKSSDTHTEGSK